MEILIDSVDEEEALLWMDEGHWANEPETFSDYGVFSVGGIPQLGVTISRTVDDPMMHSTDALGYFVVNTTHTLANNSRTAALYLPPDTDFELVKSIEAGLRGKLISVPPIKHFSEAEKRKLKYERAKAKKKK